MRRRGRENGFSLIELMTALAILVLVCGIAFELLLMTMKKYHSDSQLLSSFQEARFGMDQMIRDINDSGYPPRNQMQGNVAPWPMTYAATPFAWAPTTYPTNPCTIGTNCTIPSDYDLIVETDIDPENQSSTNYVEWIRYKLIGTTLYRSVVPKLNNPTSDPDGASSGALVPYVQNVMNNPSAAQLATLQAAYPSMFPGGNPVPIFRYICESTPQPTFCDGSGPTGTPAYTDPKHVVGVIVTLIVQAPTADMQTGRPLVVELKGEGRRMNPDY